MSFVQLPKDVIHDRLISFLDVRSMFRVASTNKDYAYIVHEYIQFHKSCIFTYFMSWLSERKQAKIDFFRQHITRIPSNLLHRYHFLKIFCFLDDCFHQTTFLKRVLKSNVHHEDLFLQKPFKLCDSFINHRHSYSCMDWKDTHDSFFNMCVEDIESCYHDHETKLKKKYKLILK